MMEMSRQMVLFPLIAGFETKDYQRRRSRKKNRDRLSSVTSNGSSV